MLMMVERDGRAVSHMDPESRIIHLRLEAWGHWSHDAQVRPYPKSTVLGRMIEFGCNGAAQSGPPPITMPDEIAAVDAAVARLGDIDKRCIIAYYTHWEPIESCAKRCHMRIRMFQNVLRRARWRLRLMLNNPVERNVHR